jgi:uncharacterized protein (DUF58 family)
MTGRTARGLPLPTRSFFPFAITAIILLSWGGVAHQSGSGWVQAIGVLIGGFAVIGLLAPAVTCWLLRLTVVSMPEDIVAGSHGAIVFGMNHSARLGLRHDENDYVDLSLSNSGSGQGEYILSARYRGVVEHLDLDASSSWPFGILWWHRRVTINLERPIYVLPRSKRSITRFDITNDDGAGKGVSYGGDQRGIREYAPGDTPRDIHWPATAHTGKMMVRERDTQHNSPLLLDVRLPDDVIEADGIAQEFMGLSEAAIRSGKPVVMYTLEPHGRVQGIIRDSKTAGRRLSRAVCESAYSIGPQ